MVNRHIFILLLVTVLFLLMFGCEEGCVSRIISKINYKWSTTGHRQIDLDFSDAFAEGDLDKAKRLLDEGADINVQYKRMGGYTSLMMIAGGGQWPEGMQFLLDNGADPNMRLNDGRTALMLAANRGNLDYVQRLLQAGADPSLVAGDGSTASSLAAAAGHDEIASLLEGALSEKKGTS